MQKVCQNLKNAVFRIKRSILQPGKVIWGIITIIVFALGGLTTFLNGIKEKEARTKEINEAVDKQFKLYLESKDDDLR